MKKQKTFKLSRRIRSELFWIGDYKNMITNSGIDFDSIYDSNYHEVKIINPRTKKLVRYEPRLTVYYK